MRICYTSRAFFDRESIFDYLDERSPRGAFNVQRAITQAIRSLEAYPRLGRLTAVAEVRELTVPRYPYEVYYRVDGGEIGFFISATRDAGLGWSGRSQARKPRQISKL